MKLTVRLSLFLFSIGTFQYAASQQVPEAKRDSSIDQQMETASEDFRESVCAMAIDFENANQQQAITIAAQCNFVDKRFDAAIYRVLKESTRPDGWIDTQPINSAVQLMALSTLSSESKSQLLFECYLASDQERKRLAQERLSSRRLDASKSVIAKQLRSMPQETNALIKKRFQSGEYSVLMFELIVLSKESIPDLLPDIVKAVKSKDPAVASVALDLSSQMIDRWRSGELKADENRPVIQDKSTVYAEKIFERYDTNKDGRLNRAESDRMLMNPIQSDTNNDGEVTVAEYAEFLRLRGKSR